MCNLKQSHIVSNGPIVFKLDPNVLLALENSENRTLVCCNSSDWYVSTWILIKFYCFWWLQNPNFCFSFTGRMDIKTSQNSFHELMFLETELNGMIRKKVNSSEPLTLDILVNLVGNLTFRHWSMGPTATILFKVEKSRYCVSLWQFLGDLGSQYYWRKIGMRILWPQNILKCDISNES